MSTVADKNERVEDGNGRAADILATGREVLAREADAVGRAQANLGPAFVQAIELIMHCPGRVAVTGMGKAGLVGRKIQATLASTATRSYSLHPAEAIHGDMGMISGDDLIIALSNSGETQELVKLLPVFKKLGCKIILLTGRPGSQCGKLADVVLDIGDTPEACPLGLAPSSSTTAMLALGDALALTVMKLKNVQPEEFAAFHPGGALGRSLMKVHEIMRTGADCPTVGPEATVAVYYEVLQRAPRRAGAAAVVDAAGKLVGFFTHGDFVRCFHHDGNPLAVCMKEVMTASPKFARQDDLVASALHTMQQYKIDELPVVDGDAHRLVGMIDIQDLIAGGFSAFDDQ
jgi:arabinose-5-phosphate isomerase